MKYPQTSPMSRDEYLKRTFGPKQWKETSKWISIVSIGFVLGINLFAWLSQTWAPRESWLVLGVVLAITWVIALIANRRLYPIDHEWHLFRGYILDVQLPNDGSGRALILFDGDKAYTRFSTNDYEAHKDILQADKSGVLVVRRSIELGAPTYEAVVYKSH